MPDIIRAPFTPEQVDALNRFQRESGMHPFTCDGDHPGGVPHLIALEDGWHCWLPWCDYRQDWAHPFMTDPEVWPKRTSFEAAVAESPTPKAPQSAFAWAQSVASHGTGPTAVIDIDVHAPGHDEPVPVEIPLDQARVLYAMLGGVLAEHGEPIPIGRGQARNGRTVARLRERLERAHTEGFVQSRQIGDLKRELKEAEATVRRVRALHHPSSFPNPDAPGTITYCVGCDEGTGGHPCPTIDVLDAPAAANPGQETP